MSQIRKFTILLFVLIMGSPVFSIEKESFMIDLGTGIGSKYFLSVVFAFKYFVAEDVAIEAYVGGSPASIGVGMDVIWFPEVLDYTVYPSVGMSWLYTDIDRDPEVDGFENFTLNMLSLNASIGYNSPRFDMAGFFNTLDSGEKVPTSFYAEAGIGKSFWKDVFVNGKKIQDDEYLSVEKGEDINFVLPHLEVGLRQTKGW